MPSFGEIVHFVAACLFAASPGAAVPLPSATAGNKKGALPVQGVPRMSFKKQRLLQATHIVGRIAAVAGVGPGRMQRFAVKGAAAIVTDEAAADAIIVRIGRLASKLVVLADLIGGFAVAACPEVPAGQTISQQKRAHSHFSGISWPKVPDCHVPGRAGTVGPLPGHCKPVRMRLCCGQQTAFVSLKAHLLF
jgi:hypothetical protein